ncbi:rust resistance kinase Lr10-like [Argentina anserina]|uniref:rust resistance kinase Lr10-like n=1 Tax=Argentina anserina TaxID=57926 RepID=UPI0021763353|nr:rust resistance kinase Lr10-like [Potentilla anserina]
MDILLLLCALLVLVPNNKASYHHVQQPCPKSRCSHEGPLIQFPFRLKGDPPHCGNPKFEVSCGRSNNTNVTMIQLSSSSGLFPINKIDYNNKYFGVYDGDGCMANRLLNFTVFTKSRLLFHPSSHSISLRSSICNDNYGPVQSPYSAQHPNSDYAQPPYPDSAQSPYSDSPQSPYPESVQFYKNFALLNCSTTLNVSRRTDYYMPIRCLSVPGHHQVLAVELWSSIDNLANLPLSTCTTLKKNFYLPLKVVDGSFYCAPDNVLLIQWKPWVHFPECRNCIGRCDMDYKSNTIACYPYPNAHAKDPAYYHPNNQEHMPKGHDSTRTTRSIIIALISASSVLISAIALVAIWYYLKKSDRVEEKENQIKIEKFLDDHKSHVPSRYSYADIKKMTNGFRKKLGGGGFGSVYSGKLPSNGVPVAIKVLKDSKGNGDDFVNEVGTIGRIHHVNVVRLLGFSAEGGKRALIYEHMPNSSLEKFITSKDQSRDTNSSFDWMKLRNIITGIAKGIEYLHQGCDQRILHFDIKPHNILLDHDFNPKISDFGLAKLCSKEDSLVSMTAARGTIGYIAPEVFNGNFGTVSHKSDVYSFGMLVLEVIGARKESVLTSANSEVYFPELIYKSLMQGEELDLELGDDGDAEIAKRLAIIALWCIQWYPVNRPSMKGVVRMLEGASESLIMPPNPFASTSQSDATIALPT